MNSSTPQIQIIPNEKLTLHNAPYNLDQIIYDLDTRIDMLSSKADKLDYLVSIASGVLCGLLDILWVGEFDLHRGRDIASDKVDGLVKKTAKMLGCKDSDDMTSAVKFLEEKFPIPSDGNTPQFGGGKQHHLRDFAHHPTIVGLVFSLLTQFTHKSYGTDTKGRFLVVDVPKRSKNFIGNNLPEKIFNGTFVWFFHLVSDVAGSSSTAGITGGTGIPGPLLSLVKEVSVLPFFKNMKIGDNSLSLFLSKLFNGTLFAKRDANGEIIKDTVLQFDLRGELGLLEEVTRQAVPVVANECIVRGFYLIRHMAVEMKEKQVRNFVDMKLIEWNDIKPKDNPTISRMLLIATGVFTTVDVGEAVVSKKYWVSVNCAGVGRFAIALGEDIGWNLKARQVKKIKAMYEEIATNTYRELDNNIYKKIGEGIEVDKFGLNLAQTEILYNVEYHKTLNDIENTNNRNEISELKKQWIEEWRKYISSGFSDFVGVEGATINWYSKEELTSKIEEEKPEEVWYRILLLEAMLFVPYYPLSTFKDKKGNEKPDKSYSKLKFNKKVGDKFLNRSFANEYLENGYVDRLRRTYKKSIRELNEVMKTAIKSLSIVAVITVAVVATAGAYAGPIAVALVGANFSGLSGAALTSACLAYLGGGAIAAGGAGMLGGTIAIVGGGAALGLGVGTGVGGAVAAVNLLGKKNEVLQSAKLLVSVKEIFLNDEQDVAFSNTVCEKYSERIAEAEKQRKLMEIKLSKETRCEEKKKLKEEIKNAKESIEVMELTNKNMWRFKSCFEVGKEMGGNNEG